MRIESGSHARETEVVGGDCVKVFRFTCTKLFRDMLKICEERGPGERVGASSKQPLEKMPRSPEKGSVYAFWMDGHWSLIYEFMDA